jgi:hypothetical protein
MARFVQFKNVIGKTVWINPDCVVGVTQSHIDEHTVAIVGADGENPWFVPGTVAEVLAKLQGDPQPEQEQEEVILALDRMAADLRARCKIPIEIIEITKTDGDKIEIRRADGGA